MRLDCPHCHKSLSGKFLRWKQLQQTKHLRSCPICGGEIEFRLYPHELATRAFAIVVAIATGYWINSRGDGLLKPLIVGTLVLVAGYLAERFLLRDAQRYQTGRNAR